MIEKRMCPPSRGRSGSRFRIASERLIRPRISRKSVKVSDAA
jgi:hypothetical protein